VTHFGCLQVLPPRLQPRNAHLAIRLLACSRSERLILKKPDPSTMDPISAVGCAAAIVNFVDFAYSLVKGSYEIYKSDSGGRPGHADINTVLADLDGVTRTLQSNVRTDNPHREPLSRLAWDCNTVSAELSGLLNDLKRKQGNKVWRSIEAKWSIMRKEGRLASVEQRLVSLRLELLLRLNVIIK